ncbi:hypothetical protein [Streptomyces blastmyceticus]|uniref:Glyoxalase/Bleomycin resistance-like N-terminal domain-containing protein n=1 Tax=Streptomyces blastmyceticus TaxID=68180 RepID=A0ABP3HR52_9ACTN
MSDSFKKPRTGPAYVSGMGIRIEVFELVVADMARSLAFYRDLGLGILLDPDGNPVDLFSAPV